MAFLGRPTSRRKMECLITFSMRLLRSKHTICHTIDQITSQNKHVLNNVGSLLSGLEDALRLVVSKQKGDIIVRAALHSLLPLLLANFVYRLDLLQVIFCDCLCSYCALPGDWSGSNVVLQRQDVRRGIHVDGGQVQQSIGVVRVSIASVLSSNC